MRPIKSLPLSDSLDVQAKRILNKYSLTVFKPSTATCYSDSAGSTPTVQDGQVACIVDSNAKLGPELVGNPNFDDTSWWTLTQPTSGSVTISGGLLNITSLDGSYASATKSSLCVAGKVYKYKIVVSSVSVTGVAVAIGSGVSTYLSAPGTYSGYITATNTTLEIKRNSGACNATIDNISVREVIGYVATQSTTGYMPKLRKGAKNVFTNSEFPNGLSDVPTGGASGITLSSLSGYSNAIGFGYDGVTLLYAYKAKAIEGVPVVFSCVVKMNDNGAPSFGAAGSNNVANDFAIVVNNAAISPTTYIVQNLGNNTYRVSGTTISAVTGNANACGIIKYTTNSSRTFVVTAYQLTYGTTVEPYVATTSAPLSNGVGPWWLDFDGVDDYLALSSVPFQQTDKHYVSAVVKCNSVAAVNKPVIHIGGATDTARLSTLYFISNDTNAVRNTWRDDANTQIVFTDSATTGTNIVSMSGVFDGTRRSLRVKSKTIGTSEASLGTTTLSSATVGRNTVGTLYLPGAIYSIVLGKLNTPISESEMKILEKFFSKEAGLSI